MNVPLEDQIDEVERELAMRRRIYGRLVEGKKMTQAKADQATSTMQAVLETLLRLQASTHPSTLPLSRRPDHG